MKILNIFFFVVLMNSFAFAQEQETKELNSFHWLIGRWERIPTKEGKVSAEEWSVVSENKLVGIGSTVNAGDTVFVEHLSIELINGKLFYLADVSHNDGAVFFEITEFGDHGFVCKNPKHDFPKEISYQKEGDQLTAIISGDGKSIPFNFRKVK